MGALACTDNSILLLQDVLRAADARESTNGRDAKSEVEDDKKPADELRPEKDGFGDENAGSPVGE